MGKPLWGSLRPGWPGGFLLGTSVLFSLFLATVLAQQIGDGWVPYSVVRAISRPARTCALATGPFFEPLFLDERQDACSMPWHYPLSVGTSATTATVKTITSVSVTTITTETSRSVLVTAMVYFSPPLFNLNGVSLQGFSIQFADCGFAPAPLPAHQFCGRDTPWGYGLLHHPGNFRGAHGPAIDCCRGIRVPPFSADQPVCVSRVSRVCRQPL